MSRDIVQFVPFREFNHDKFILAKETLQEIPGQVTDFFLSRNIYPMPAKEEQRKKIAAQLSLKSDANNQQQVLDMHQGIQKEKLIGTAQQMGLDTFQCQDIIEEKGLWENNVDLLLDLIQRPNVENPLKISQAPQGYAMGVGEANGYGYFDPQDR